MKIKLIRSFSAAHRLPHYDGPCHNLHGHTWKTVFVIDGPVQPDGMVCDFKVIKKLLDENLPDHHYLNDVVENPTAENLAQYLFTKIGTLLAAKNLTLVSLEVWESDHAAAIVER